MTPFGFASLSEITSALVMAVTFIAGEAGAQSLASRVSSVRDGKVRLTFAAKPGVCGYGNSISRGGSRRFTWTSDESADVTYDEECSQSPVRLVLNVEGGRITKLRTYVGGTWRPATAGTTDLGAVSTREAAGFLLGLASSDEGTVGREAILPATLADSIVIWPQLFRVARDENRPSQTRKQALFWLGQAAGDVIAPERFVEHRATDDEEVRKQAVFALSQRRNGEAVPALIQIARDNRNPEIRRTALFWLGQTMDPRALSLFEEILGR
jgi:hypothetical protein